ncbi:C40 family peptidase [Salinifilum aidingensis]
MSSAPALADPPLPDNATDAAREVRELSHKTEQVTEEAKKAADDHRAKKEELDRASAEAVRAERVADQARTEEQRFRGRVDELTSASYQGARLNKLSALLASESPNDFLDRAATLDVLAQDNNEVIHRLAAATDRAEKAETRSQQARDRAAKAEREAARIAQDMERKRAEMEQRVAEVQQRYDELSQQEQESLVTDGSTDVGAVAGSGAAVTAVNAALGKQGSPYVWGAKGPDSFDCSGLTYWAYEQAGVSIGGSTKTQISDGESVSSSELKPGDLIFYYSPVSHVSMYIGNGKAVHAPTQGDVVKVDDYDDIGPVTEMRRIAG